MSDPPRYVPAAGRTRLTRLYDPVLAVTMRERRFRTALAHQVTAELPQRGTVVDVGCGTGTFAIELAARRPDANVVGVDGDPGVLAIAQRKPHAASVTWRNGFAGELPLPDIGTDAIVMSLLLHHLDPDAKTAALADALRALRPGGRLHVADWGRPQDPVMRGLFLALQTLDGFKNTRDHARGRLPILITAAGFADVTTRARMRTAWGALELLHARRPDRVNADPTRAAR